MPDYFEGRGMRIFEGHHSVHLKDGNINVNKNYKSRRKDGTDYVFNSNASYSSDGKNKRKVARSVRKSWGRVKLVWK